MTTARSSISPTGRPGAAPGRDFFYASAAYSVYAFAVCVLFFPTLAAMIDTWANSSSYHHGFLVAPIALWMIVRTGRTTTSPARPSFAALAGVAGASAVWLIGHAAAVNLVEQIGFVGLLIAGVAAIFGRAHFRGWAFPLLFLLFAVPFGSVLLPGLQEATAKGAVALLNVTGVPADLEGVVIATSSGAYEIAEACAGLNFLLAALMVAALYAWMAFRDRRKMAAFFVFAVIFALAANLLRTYVVILAATLTAGKYGVGSDHIAFGWVFYGLLLFVLIAIGRRFADPAAVRKRTAPAEMAGRAPVRSTGGAALVAAFAIIAATAGYARSVVDNVPAAHSPASLPHLNAPGWQVAAPFPSWRAAIGHADRSLHASYSSKDVAVQLAVGYFTYDRVGAEIAGYATRPYDGEEWRRIGAHTISTRAFGERREIHVATLESRWGDRLDVAELYWLGDAVFEDPGSLKLAQAFRRAVGRRDRGGVIFVAAPERTGTQGEAALRAFLASVEPLASWLARIDAKITN